jgi:hypothetical protein
MAKPTGLVTLDTGHALYDKLIGLVAFTEQDTDGPARMLEPGPTNTNMTYTDNNAPDEPENAWNDNPPSFSTNGSTDERVYTVAAGIIPHMPCSIAMHVRADSTNPGFILGLRDNSNPTVENLWIQMGNTAGTRLNASIERSTGLDNVATDPGAWVSSTYYSIVINFHDTAVFTYSTVPADGDTVTINIYNGGSPVSNLYTYRDTITTTANEVKRTAGDAVACRDALRKAINLNGIAGTDYGNDTVIHDAVTALDDGDNLRVYRKADIPGDGTSGRLTLNDSGTWGSWSVGRLGLLSTTYFGDAFVEMFVDGVSTGSHQEILTDGTSGNTYPELVDELEIGATEGSATFPTATFDLVAFFDRALNATDISTWHDEGAAGAGNYNLIGGSGTTIVAIGGAIVKTKIAITG